MNSNKLKRNRGITLIALVITIIVMLILVAVTISMAVNGGLFDYAGKATSVTQNAVDAEQELGSGKIKIGDVLYNNIDDYIEGKELEEPLVEGPKVGDYVNYTPTEGTYTVASGANGSGYTSNQTFSTDSSLKWRILSIDKATGEIELVSETSVHKLYLKGANGYNHAVDILNDLCEKLYSNEIGATARSINEEDITKKTTYDYTTYYNSYEFKYGDTKQLSVNGANYMKYPNIYSQEIGYGTAGVFNNETTGLKGSKGKNDGVTDEDGVTTYSTVTGYTNGNTAGIDVYVTSTEFRYNIEEYLDTQLGINTAPEGLLHIGVDYWLATRYVNAETYGASFCVRRMIDSSGNLGGRYLYYSKGEDGEWGYPVRPVVTLDSDSTLTKDMEKTTETTIYWNLAV